MGKKKDVVYLGVCLSPATHEDLKKLAAYLACAKKSA